jgi:hypothetical protein
LTGHIPDQHKVHLRLSAHPLRQPYLPVVEYPDWVAPDRLTTRRSVISRRTAVHRSAITGSPTNGITAMHFTNSQVLPLLWWNHPRVLK